MSDDRCQALSPLQDGKALWCTLPAGHTDDHYNGEYYWANVPHVQGRGPEPAYCGITHPAGHGLGTCNLDAGHDGNHSSGLANWPPARSNYRSDDLAGAKIDDLILDLFRRIEQLEQDTASGAATDDMFAAQERRIARLEQRIRYLERQLSSTPQTYDFSALQASITSHLNRALTDLGSGLDTRFTLLTEALRARGRNDEQRHAQTGAKLDTMWEMLRVMAEAIDRIIPAGHPEECHGEVCFKSVPDGAQTERASGSPAAVRCPAQFREGQCLGYAGHEGECSALPDPWEPQLEDPGEFECGMDPAPGHSMPPCGRPKGHDGPCG